MRQTTDNGVGRAPWCRVGKRMVAVILKQPSSRLCDLRDAPFAFDLSAPMVYVIAMDFDAVRQTAGEVIEAMWAADPQDARFPRKRWPEGSCEQVAVAMAAVLEDRGLGEWTFVTAGRPGKTNGHAWLEARNADGAVVFSIDPTLMQFLEWSEPFIGEGKTPAAAHFTIVRWEGAVWEWPHLGGENGIFRELIRAVREELARP